MSKQDLIGESYDTLPKECDVVVVGSGGAGLTAALTAALSGAQVVLLEKEPVLGGTTAMAVGSISAAGTDLQHRKGIQDNVDEFVQDIGKFAGELQSKDNPVLRRVLGSESAKHVEWLKSLGVSFVGPFSEPPHRVPRMHNAVPTARAYVAALTQHARKAGVKMVTNAPVQQLIQAQSGRVTGVRVSIPIGREVEIVARRGVILSSGDFSNSPELKGKYLGPDAVTLPALNPACTGDGHRMGAEAGGELVNMDIGLAEIRFPPPPVKPLLQRMPVNLKLMRFLTFFANRLPQGAIRPLAKQMLVSRMAPVPKMYADGAILVNQQGERFSDERNVTAYDVNRQPGQQAYMIISESIAQQYSSGSHYISTAPGIAYAYFKDYKRGRPDLIKRGDNLTRLAEQLQMEPSALSQAVEQANKDRNERGESAPLSKGPYYAMGPLLPAFTATEGGLAIDERCRVLTPAGQPIPGLYAAGNTGLGGLVIPGHGLHILWAITSGRISGQAAAENDVG